ncbi:MAG: sigma-54-dependent Fis family transcriptional regulator [candidate division WOR-3 bacterium]|nr:MAG: sigma-54-dependent Fis family transcriptional regulator [candidate division WOR-3 bacterium]
MPDRPVRLLLVEDNPGDADLVLEMLDEAAPGGFTVDQAARLAQGVEILSQGKTDLTLTDLGLPDSSGLDTFHALLTAAPDVPVVVLTGSDNPETGLAAVRSGAQDYLVKGRLDAPLLVRTLRYAVERKRAELALRESEERYRGMVEVALAAAADRNIEGLVFGGMIRRHPQMLQSLAIARKVADARVPVLVRGESGVGKELVSRAVHDSGSRRDKPFVVINSAAVPGTLLEAELFGVEPGAATGVAGRRGKLEEADGGTVFLDEVGDMELPLQSKLLRFLQDGVVERVGRTKPVAVDVRIVAATNQDLEEMIRQGRFRKDLYFRLNAVELSLPPLRGSSSDIRDFVFHFVDRCSRESGRSIRGISPQALARLVAHDWPGNIRQLQHVIHRAVLVAEGDTIDLGDLPTDLHQVAPVPDELPQGRARPALRAAHERMTSEVERRLVLDCLEKSGWRVTEAAKLAGYSRVHMHRLMRKHGIRRPK